MPTITKHFTNVQVLKLTDEPGKSGPLIAVQHGVAPGDMTVEQRMFLLCRDGQWADVVALGAAGNDKLWDQTMFESPSQVLALLEKLEGSAEVLSLEVTKDPLASWLSRTAGLDAQQRVQNLVNLFKKRAEQRKS